MVLTGVREDQIDTCLAALSLDEIDILIKYVYKGLGMPRNNGPLFKWHAKVCGSATSSFTYLFFIQWQYLPVDNPPSSSLPLLQLWNAALKLRCQCFLCPFWSLG